MSILSWIGFGIGLLAVTLLGWFLGFFLGGIIAMFIQGDEQVKVGYPLVGMFLLPILTLIGGVCIKMVLLDNVWLILALVGGINFAAVSISMYLSTLPSIDRLKAKGNVKGLIKVLGYKEGEQKVRKVAAETLGQIGDAQAVEPLIAAFKDSDSDVRQAAAEALGRLGDVRAIEPLIAALQDSSSDVRQAAAEMLVKIGTPAVEPLIAALEDGGRDVRRNAAKTLGKLGDVRAVKPLIAALQDSGSDGVFGVKGRFPTT